MNRSLRRRKTRNDRDMKGLARKGKDMKVALAVCERGTIGVFHLFYWPAELGTKVIVHSLHWRKVIEPVEGSVHRARRFFLRSEMATKEVKVVSLRSIITL